MLDKNKVQLKAVCKYFILCDSNCPHAKEHTPLYKGNRSDYPDLASLRRNNCCNHPGRFGQCQSNIPSDRLCVDTNAEELADRFVKNLLAKKI